MRSILTPVLAPAAFAQTNVTLYGIADAGASADRTGGSGFSTTVRVNSGYMSSSRFGVTGSEDLGAASHPTDRMWRWTRRLLACPGAAWIT